MFNPSTVITITVKLNETIMHSRELLIRPSTALVHLRETHEDWLMSFDRVLTVFKSKFNIQPCLLRRNKIEGPVCGLRHTARISVGSVLA